VGRVENAAAGPEPGVGGDVAALHRHRLAARGDLKLIAMAQDPVARLGKRLPGGGGDVVEGQVVHVGVDLEQGDVQVRLAGHHLGVVQPAVVQVHAQVGRVQDV